MHLTVGYLATPTGDDGVALASAIAKTFDAEVDVVLVVRQEMPDGHPGRAEYRQLLVNRGEGGSRGPSAHWETGASTPTRPSWSGSRSPNR